MPKIFISDTPKYVGEANQAQKRRYLLFGATYQVLENLRLTEQIKVSKGLPNRQVTMARSKDIYKEQTTIFAKHFQTKSEFLEYKSTLHLKDLGKQSITMELKSNGVEPSCAPMPPKEHIIRAKDIIDLFLKLKRWFAKYGYEIK